MKIVSIEPLGITSQALNELSSRLTSEGHTFISYPDREENLEKLSKRVFDADVVILANQPFKADVIHNCKNLKMISIAFTGVDHVDVQECKNRGIIVCNAAGYSTNAVAELAFALMIDVYRFIIDCDKAVRKEKTKGTMIGYELCGKKLGIIGTGAIGLKVAEIGKAFGCEIIAYSRTKKADSLGIEYYRLDDVMKHSDIVSLHIPFNADTKGIISAEKIALMKPSAILINTARGGIVDNIALSNALKENKIAGAGIDVFEMEPPIPSDHPLISAPNTILTPHVAFATTESLYKRAVIVFDNIKLWMQGNPQNLI